MIDNVISPFLKLWEGQGHDLINWEGLKSSRVDEKTKPRLNAYQTNRTHNKRQQIFRKITVTYNYGIE